MKPIGNSRKAPPDGIAIRVLNDAEIGGLYRRGFVWAEKPGDKEK